MASLPGSFVTPDRPLGSYVCDAEQTSSDIDPSALTDAFQVGDSRVYEDDPRFGLNALSEIASRALSPAVNDAGTAIDIIGRFLRLFTEWGSASTDGKDEGKPRFDRVEIPEISIDDMFEDAFSPIARDGAGTVEVQVRLQKALASLASSENDDIKAAAERHSRLLLKRAESELTLGEDIEAVSKSAQWSGGPGDQLPEQAIPWGKRTAAELRTVDGRITGCRCNVDRYFPLGKHLQPILRSLHDRSSRSSVIPGE